MSAFAQEALACKHRRDTHDGLDIAELQISRDYDRLNQELVFALSVQRRILLHSLEKDCKGGMVSFVDHM